jgi:hypothetical protein
MSRTLNAVFAVGLLVFYSPLLAQQPATLAKAQAAEHAHAEHGPHGGELLEIGKEEYHVELVIDEAKKQLVVYLMDGKVKSFVAIDAPFLAVNLKMAGKPVQVKLAPMPQEMDQKGFSSRFGIVSPPLVDALHTGHAEARLAIKIGKKAYTVKMDHDHAGHAHGPKDAK